MSTTLYQLSLFEEATQPPLTIERPVNGWADGDVSRTALERLASVVIGEPITAYWGPPISTAPEKDRWKFKDDFPVDGYTRHLYRCISTRIDGDCVIGTYQYDCVLTCKTQEEGYE